MKLWVDAQLSPRLAGWLKERFGLESEHLESAGLRDADDLEVFRALCKVGAVIVTKDSDFIDLVTRLGTPPHVIWVRIGNCGNDDLCAYLERVMTQAIELIRQGESVVELRRESSRD